MLAGHCNDGNATHALPDTLVPRIMILSCRAALDSALSRAITVNQPLSTDGTTDEKRNDHDCDASGDQMDSN
ncbi:MAG: hypothetical protein ACRYHA_27850 [Janthinobacterium lividum]